MNVTEYLVIFPKYFLKVTVTLLFFETAIGNTLINTNTLN